MFNTSKDSFHIQDRVFIYIVWNVKDRISDVVPTLINYFCLSFTYTKCQDGAFIFDEMKASFGFSTLCCYRLSMYKQKPYFIIQTL